MKKIYMRNLQPWESEPLHYENTAACIQCILQVQHTHKKWNTQHNNARYWVSHFYCCAEDRYAGSCIFLLLCWVSWRQSVIQENEWFFPGIFFSRSTRSWSSSPSSPSSSSRSGKVKLWHHLPGNTKRGSISVPFTSCLTGLVLDYSVLQIRTKNFSCHTADSKPVKQEVNGTVILPPLVFPTFM